MLAQRAAVQTLIMLLGVCLLAAVLLSACGPSERVAPPPEFATPGPTERASPPSEFVPTSPDDSVSVLPIKQGTVGSAGDLSIGVRSVYSGAYADEQGVPRSGLLASLQLWAKDRPSQQERVIVHVGQRLEFAGYAIFVEEIREGGVLEGIAPMPGSSSDSVTLRVRVP